MKNIDSLGEDNKVRLINYNANVTKSTTEEQTGKKMLDLRAHQRR